MPKQRLLLPLLPLLLGIIGCDDQWPPTGPAAPRAPQYALSDAAHGGASGFYFLPPMVTDPSPFSGSFDALAAPEVRICEWVVSACVDGGYSATFTQTSNPAVVLDVLDKNYNVNWNTKGLGFQAGDVFRVRVFQGASELGYADVQVVANPKELKTVGSDFVGLIRNTPLLIKFTIRTETRVGQIAFASDRDNGNLEIYVMNADGTNPVRLTNHEARDLFPAWSPDGTKIAFTSDRDNGNAELYVMNADGTNPVRLTTHEADDLAPAWSPDGTKIAFTSERDGNLEIYVMNADGTNTVRLTDHPERDAEPDWSPDGTKIAFWSERDGNSEIYVMNADGTNPTNLTDDPELDPELDAEPAWSPDGTKIAFWSTRGIGDQIYVMNADGTNPTGLPVTNASEPAWSPDGTKIAFRDGFYEIYVMNADGTNQTNLTNIFAAHLHPAWKP
jgi:Tol biopolymer transport system component